MADVEDRDGMIPEEPMMPPDMEAESVPAEALVTKEAPLEAMPEDGPMAMDEAMMAEEQRMMEEQERLEQERLQQEQMAMDEAMMAEERRMMEEQERLERERLQQEQMAMDEAMMAEERRMMEEQERAEQERLATEQAQMDAEMLAMEAADRLRPIPGLLDPASLEPHPYADLLPRMRPGEFADLKRSLQMNGLQTPIVRFQGKVLDGRNRCSGCDELGLLVPAFEFMGTEDQALTFVLSSNQNRRDLSPSQRAAVALALIPQISQDVATRRAEKIRQYKLGQSENQILAISPESENDPAKPITSRAIAAEMMNVSENYVGHAKRIREASVELFEKVRSGAVTIPEALRKLNGTDSDPQALHVKKSKSRVNKLLKNLEENPTFLERLDALLAEFPES